MGALAAILVAWWAPPTSPSAADAIRGRADQLSGLAAPGDSPSLAPSSSWPGALLLAARDAVVSPRTPNRAEDEPARRAYLRGVWIALAGLVAAAAGTVAAKFAPTHAAPIAQIAASFAVAVSPGLLVGVTGLSSGLWAALLLCGVARVGLGREGRASATVVVALGALLMAWTAYAVPLLGAISLLEWRAGRPGRRIALQLTLCIAIGWALDPIGLTRPLVGVGRLSAEWIRAIGEPAFRSGISSFAVATAAQAAGPFLLLVSTAAVLFGLRRGGGPVIIATVFALLYSIGLPAALGGRSGGALQIAAVPLLLAWGVGAAARFSTDRKTAGVFALLGIVGVLGAVSGSTNWSERVRARAQTGAALEADLARWIGRDVVWLTERRIDGIADSIGHPVLLPRDREEPGRSDYAYWPRWWAGARFALVSGARTRENLAARNRPHARAFYHALANTGRLVAEWGEGVEGFRLYQLPDDAQFRRPLDVDEATGGVASEEMISFVSVLGGAYAQTGNVSHAVGVLRIGLSLAPESLPLTNDLGNAYLLLGDARAAAELFDGALRRAPASYELGYNAARAFEALGAYERAERCLRVSLAARPREPAAHYLAARLFVAQGKDELAVQALDRFLALAPPGPQAERAGKALEALRSSRAVDAGATLGGAAPAESSFPP